MTMELMPEKLNFHPLIRPHTNTYARVMAAFLGWRILRAEEFDEILVVRFSGQDDVGLAAEVLKEAKNSIHFSFKQAIGPLIKGEIDHFEIQASLAQQLVGHCWAVLQEAGLVPFYGSSIVESFRHIRNGCFHGNKFFFKANQPSNLAAWRGISITKSLEGAKIFRDSLNDKSYILNWGDPLVLLNDVTNELSRFQQVEI